MRRRLVIVSLALAALAASGCGSDGGSAPKVAAGAASTTSMEPRATTSGRASTTTSAPRLVNGKPHFDTPEAAMTYLAAAWNANDLVSLKHVTDPSARDELNAMHDVAVNLQLKTCVAREGAGDYTCSFSHDYPPHASTTVPEAGHEHPRGEAVFLVGPADTPGWYMTVFESCG